ncbi:MAG TPA: monovalent cation/H(+) antiporter subunit G [Nocardioidaceae bacterium]|nr:monovalent cation/H(+) antiporter subunit G [Nocardioidaceae bacterium]
MNLSTFLDVVAATCFTLGAFLAFVAAIGIMRFPDLLARMHSGTKPQVIGLIFMLIGLGTQLRDLAASGILVLIVLFQLFTSPVATHMMARATYRAGQVPPESLVVDELTPVLHDEDAPPGAP